MNAEQLEKRQLRFILREFVELQQLLRKVIQIEQGNG